MPTQTSDTFDTFLPSTFNRADGLEGRPGTPNGNGLLIGGSGFFFEEMPDSPEIERGEQATIVHKFRCDPDTAYALISTIGRGYTLMDSYGNTSRVVNSKMIWGRGNVCQVHITAESLNWDWPVDEFSLDITELNPAIEKHPRYNLLSYKDRIMVHGAVQAEGIEFRGMYDGIIDAIKNDPTIDPPTAIMKWAQAKELAFKLHKGTDSFYLPGFRIQYSNYYSIPPYLNPGGFIQDPVESGALPYYFWSTNNTVDPNSSMFNYLKIINPVIYGDGISWLRLCDTITYQRTWFRVTATWQGAPLGHWDKELYTQDPQPYQTQETEGTVLQT